MAGAAAIAAKGGGSPADSGSVDPILLDRFGKAQGGFPQVSGLGGKVFGILPDLRTRAGFDRDLVHSAALRKERRDLLGALADLAGGLRHVGGGALPLLDMVADGAQLVTEPLHELLAFIAHLGRLGLT